jgi:hypothetical protein
LPNIILGKRSAVEGYPTIFLSDGPAIFIALGQHNSADSKAFE